MSERISSNPSVRVVNLPKSKRHWNQYLLKVRAVTANVNFGAFVKQPVPSSSDVAQFTKINLSTDFLFDHDKCPDWIEEPQWQQLSRFVYSTILLGVPDTHKYLFAGVTPGDGSAAIKNIRTNVGTTQQQKAYFKREFARNKFSNVAEYHTWYGELLDLYTQFNNIWQLPERQQIVML